jgi:hypothetical protein
MKEYEAMAELELTAACIINLKEAHPSSTFFTIQFAKNMLGMKFGLGTEKRATKKQRIFMASRQDLQPII